MFYILKEIGLEGNKQFVVVSSILGVHLIAKFFQELLVFVKVIDFAKGQNICV